MAGRVRQPIDEAKFEQYLNENVPEIQTPIKLKQFHFGQSNPTYQIIDATGKVFVMRKRPPGKRISNHSHRVEREYQVLRALQDTDIPVPRAYALCTDESIIGTPFFIMEYLDGRIFEHVGMPGVGEEERQALWEDAVKTLAKLHTIDPQDIGLENFGRPIGFYNRQIRTWEAICASQEKIVDSATNTPVGRLPHFDECMRFFRQEGLQPKDATSLVHGDFKIDNLVFHKTEPRVIGVLDWESSTIGHPLSDVCQLMVGFYMARQPGASPYDLSSMLPGRTPGMLQPAQILALYADFCAYDPKPDMNWGMAFNIFKTAAICHGVAARMASKQTGSREAAQYAAIKGPLAELAWTLAQDASPWMSARL